jgi:hypothetical protein
MDSEGKGLPPGTWSVEDAARRLLQSRERRNRKISSRRQQAREKGREIALYLGTRDAGLQKVIGFGSTYETWRNYREDSDIDLAIIGGDWYFLSSIVPVTGFKVSLVDLDLQNPEFKSQVLQHGEVLYEGM